MMDQAKPVRSQGEDERLSALVAAYRARFGEYPPVTFMPADQAIEVMRYALRTGEPAPPEDWPRPGCNCG